MRDSGRSSPSRQAGRPVAPAFTLAELVRRVQKRPVVEVPASTHPTPTVSVVVPTYNHAQYIDQAVGSILEQDATFEIEILVGEDGSTDGTLERCRQLALEHPDRIRLFLHHPENRIVLQGVPTGRFNLIYLLAQARGRFVAWCDGDDLWPDRSKLAKQVRILEARPEAVMTMTNAYRSFGSGESRELAIPPGLFRDLGPRDLASGELVINTSVLFRNVLAQARFPESILDIANADTLFWACLASFGCGIASTEIEPVVYRVHRDGIWSRRSAVQRAGLRRQSLAALAEVGSDPWVVRRLEERMVAESLKGLSAAIRAGDLAMTKEFLRSLSKGLVSRPGAALFLVGEVARALYHGRKGAPPAATGQRRWGRGK